MIWRNSTWFLDLRGLSFPRNWLYQSWHRLHSSPASITFKSCLLYNCGRAGFHYYVTPALPFPMVYSQRRNREWWRNPQRVVSWDNVRFPVASRKRWLGVKSQKFDTPMGHGTWEEMRLEWLNLLHTSLAASLTLLMTSFIMATNDRVLMGDRTCSEGLQSKVFLKRWASQGTLASRMAGFLFWNCR